MYLTNHMFDFRHVFTRMGMELSFVDLQNPNNIKDQIKPNTKVIYDYNKLWTIDETIIIQSFFTQMVWLETPTNPLLKIIDIAAVSEIIRKHPDILLVVDNTFLTPYLQRPLELGADIVVYSLTKYMNGHSDVIMGAAVVNRDDLHGRLRFLQNGK